MIIIDVKNLKVVTIEDIKKLYNHILFPVNLSSSAFENTELEKLYIFLDEPEKPSISDFEYLVLSDPIKKSGKYSVKWIVKQKEFNEEIKTEYINKIAKFADSSIKAMTEGYSEYEIKTWAKQESEARSYLENNSNPTPILNALAEARGEDKKLLAEKIVSKADTNYLHVMSVLGRKKKLIDQITKATSFKDFPSDI